MDCLKKEDFSGITVSFRRIPNIVNTPSYRGLAEESWGSQLFEGEGGEYGEYGESIFATFLGTQDYC